MEVGKELAADLRARGAEVVIAITHMRVPNDIRACVELGGGNAGECLQRSRAAGASLLVLLLLVPLLLLVLVLPLVRYVTALRCVVCTACVLQERELWTSFSADTTTTLMCVRVTAPLVPLVPGSAAKAHARACAGECSTRVMLCGVASVRLCVVVCALWASPFSVFRPRAFSLCLSLLSSVVRFFLPPFSLPRLSLPLSLCVRALYSAGALCQWSADDQVWHGLPATQRSVA